MYWERDLSESSEIRLSDLIHVLFVAGIASEISFCKPNESVVAFTGARTPNTRLACWFWISNQFKMNSSYLQQYSHNRYILKCIGKAVILEDKQLPKLRSVEGNSKPLSFGIFIRVSKLNTLKFFRILKFYTCMTVWF